MLWGYVMLREESGVMLCGYVMWAYVMLREESTVAFPQAKFSYARVLKSFPKVSVAQR